MMALLRQVIGSVPIVRKIEYFRKTKYYENLNQKNFPNKLIPESVFYQRNLCDSLKIWKFFQRHKEYLRKSKKL